MFKDTKAFSGFAVPDIAAARAFYGDTLGIETPRTTGCSRCASRAARDTLVYPKPNHEPATYTILNFGVDDIEATSTSCSSGAWTSEIYDGFEQDERGIVRDAAARRSPGSATPPGTSSRR